MANIAGVYVVQQDGTLILKREYKINVFILNNDQIRVLKDECLKAQSSSVFKVPTELVTKGDNIYSACFIKRNDLFFIAVCLDNQTIGCEAMSALQMLRLLIEVTEDTIGLDKMRENFYSLTLVLDTMIDYGYPLITEKSVLVSMLHKTDIINKATNALTGQVSDKHSLPLLNGLTQLNNNANALWRFTINKEGEDPRGNGENTNAFIKDVYIDLIEYAECIYSESGDLEMQEVSGEVLLEAQVPGQKAKVAVKLRYGQELEDYAIISFNSHHPLGNLIFSNIYIRNSHYNFLLILNATIMFNIFERFSLGKDKDGTTMYPSMEQIFVKFYFPDEVSSMSLTSLPEGIFNFDEKEKVGEWTINSFTNNTDTSIKLQGNIKFNDTTINEMPASIIAIVNLKIKDYTFSGNKIEKISCNLSGGSTSKDDATVFKGVKTHSYAKNMEFRF